MSMARYAEMPLRSRVGWSLAPPTPTSRRGPATRSNRSPSDRELRGFRIGLLEVAVDVRFGGPVRLADPHRRQGPRADEPVHRHVGHPKHVGDLRDREDRWTSPILSHGGTTP